MRSNVKSNSHLILELELEFQISLSRYKHQDYSECIGLATNTLNAAALICTAVSPCFHSLECFNLFTAFTVG